MPVARILVTGIVFSGALLAAASPASAMPASCQKEFEPLMSERARYMAQIENFKKKKPSAPQACSAFGGLSGANKKLAVWIDAQKDWCQIPDDMQTGIKAQQEQIDKVRGQACNAAAKQAQMIKQMKARGAQQQRQQAGGGVGSGVRLPQGAL